MPIQKSKIPSQKFLVGDDGFIEVRGLGYPDIAQIIDVYQAQLSPLFDRITGKDKKRPLTMDNLGQIPMILITTIPGAVVHVLGLASDSVGEDDLQWISQLPVDVQTKALNAVFELSVKTAGGAAPFIEMLTGMLAAVANLGSDVQERFTRALENGSTDSRANGAS